MYCGLRRNFWWHGMKQDVARFVRRCLTCQRVKIEHKRPGGLLQPLPVPEWKWEDIAMDFVTNLPKGSRANDTIWVIVDRLTKSAHFIPIQLTYSTERLARIYVKEVVRLHGIPHTITSDRDARFTAKFWEGMQEAFGTKLQLSTAFHPQTDGQTERTIQTLEDLLRACALEMKSSWVEQLPLVEFSYNNSYQESIGMAPFEALYGRNCRSPLCWNEPGERALLGPDLIRETTDVIQVIRERMKTAQSRQKSYADKRRRPLEFEVGNYVFLKISPLKSVLRFGRQNKLSPRYMGPYEVLERIGKMAYRIALPPSLANFHNVFHVSMLRKYEPDPLHVIREEEVEVNESMNVVTEPVRIMERMERQLRNKSVPIVRILWKNRDVEEETWELESRMRDKYPHLFE